MLSIKDIQEVSFRKSNFSGYNSDDVDQFIDEVLETVTALAKENAEAKTRTTDNGSRVSELAAKNAELQEKLSILAEKIEAYRADEDGIKDAILSAQRLGNASLREAKAKAEAIVSDANARAEKIVNDARAKSQNLVESYKSQIADKEKELEMMKREVTAFRASLYEIYRSHIAVIEKIPEYDFDDEAEEIVSAPAEPRISYIPQLSRSRRKRRRSPFRPPHRRRKSPLRQPSLYPHRLLRLRRRPTTRTITSKSSSTASALT